MNLLELKKITYKYPLAEEPALKNIDLSIQKGEFITLLGTNGSGKSTLARLMAGFFKPDSGCVEIQEGCVPGIVFQQPKDLYILQQQFSHGHMQCWQEQLEGVWQIF